MDSQLYLLGTITYGDIRSALIQNKSLSTEVFEVMSSKPITATNQKSYSDVLKLMNTKEISVIPWIMNKRFIGMGILKQVLQSQKRDDLIFIIARGFGTCLRPLTNNCPKSMLLVGEKPMIEHLIPQFIELGFMIFIFLLAICPNRYVNILAIATNET